MKEGQGVMTYTSQIVYQGEWREDLKHGKGNEENLNNNETFEGEWKYGKLTGKGKMNYQTGDIYVGEFNGHIVIFFNLFFREKAMENTHITMETGMKANGMMI